MPEPHTTENAMTPEQLAELADLAVLADDQINTAATPEQRNWQGARRGAFFHSSVSAALERAVPPSDTDAP